MVDIDDGYAGFTRARLLEAFEKIQHPLSWRYHIDSRVREADIAVTEAAIAYFTATTAKFWRIGNTDLFHVVAQGYNEGPAA